MTTPTSVGASALPELRAITFLAVLALLQIYLHLHVHDAQPLKFVAQCVRTALDHAEWAETARPALLFIESLCFLYDVSFDTRAVNLLQSLWGAFQESSKASANSAAPSFTEKSFELANAIIRLMILSPRASDYFAAPAVCKELQDACHRFTTIASSLPSPIIAHLNAVTDSVLSGAAPEAAPAPAPAAGAKPDKTMPGRLFAVSVLSGPVHRLPLREEYELAFYADVPIPARAYIALQVRERGVGWGGQSAILLKDLAPTASAASRPPRAAPPPRPGRAPSRRDGAPAGPFPHSGERGCCCCCAFCGYRGGGAWPGHRHGRRLARPPRCHTFESDQCRPQPG